MTTQPSDDTAKRVRVICASHDQGNLHNRLVYDLMGERKRSFAQSYLYRLAIDDTESIDGGGGYLIVKDGSDAKLWSNVRFVVGDEALSYSRTDGERVLDSDANKYRLALPMIVAHLWDAITPNNTVIKLAASNPDVVRNSENIKAHLNGRHVAYRNGIEKTFTVEVTKIYTEGQGVIKFLQSSGVKLPAGTLLFDVGNDTFILSEFEGWNQKNPVSLDAQGMRDFISGLMADNELKTVVRSYTFEDIVDVFENATPRKNGTDYTYKLHGHDITNLVKARAKDWIDGAITKASRIKSAAIKSTSGKIATGGACLIAPVRNAFIEKGFTVVSDPIWANAEGCYELLAKSEGRQAASYAVVVKTQAQIDSETAANAATAEAKKRRADAAKTKRQEAKAVLVEATIDG